MSSRAELSARLDFKREALDKARAAYIALLDGQVKSYSIGSRNLTKFDLPQLEDSIKKLENEVDELEAALCGKGRRKAVGVVIRDW